KAVVLTLIDKKGTPSSLRRLQSLAQAERGAEDLFEESALLAGGLELQVHRIARQHLQGDLAAADGAIELLDPRGMGAVQGVGHAQQGGELADGPLLPGLEGGERRMEIGR